ncbi:unnamed protein product [Ceutorhynchus assimilis]|uniref:Uncharacterized protein n=1 Tax=Ceutorhynchus assimilis TaxID=467358 RepID=A0A9N9MA65_9CUCU|nr:unnamed protein product [Ceutorhynchus assimilis]
MSANMQPGRKRSRSPDDVSRKSLLRKLNIRDLYKLHVAVKRSGLITNGPALPLERGIEDFKQIRSFVHVRGKKSHSSRRKSRSSDRSISPDRKRHTDDSREKSGRSRSRTRRPSQKPCESHEHETRSLTPLRPGEYRPGHPDLAWRQQRQLSRSPTEPVVPLMEHVFVEVIEAYGQLGPTNPMEPSPDFYPQIFPHPPPMMIPHMTMPGYPCFQMPFNPPLQMPFNPRLQMPFFGLPVYNSQEEENESESIIEQSSGESELSSGEPEQSSDEPEQSSDEPERANSMESSNPNPRP